MHYVILLLGPLLLVLHAGAATSGAADTRVRSAKNEPARIEAAASGGNVAIPVSVQQFLNRAELCEHFAGEFNGDRSDRDRQVNEQLRKLKCDRVPVDLKALQVKHKNNVELLKRLKKYE